jgi:hypothetical protein
MGITVDTTGISDANFEGDDDDDGEDVSIGRAEFFSRITQGRVVEAQGDWDGSTITWVEMELE